MRQRCVVGDGLSARMVVVLRIAIVLRIVLRIIRVRLPPVQMLKRQLRYKREPALRSGAQARERSARSTD